MKFYDREEELKILHEVQEQSFGDHSRFTVVDRAETGWENEAHIEKL